ncbi:MAG: hypothetical protein MJ236_04755 [Clostridia bacterium]|nr:hypothetical protein [Clostridia bacterium]
MNEEELKQALIDKVKRNNLTSKIVKELANGHDLFTGKREGVIFWTRDVLVIFGTAVSLAYGIAQIIQQMVENSNGNITFERVIEIVTEMYEELEHGENETN